MLFKPLLSNVTEREQGNVPKYPLISIISLNIPVKAKVTSPNIP